MSTSESPDTPAGPSRRAVILTGGALGILAGLGAFRPARADAAAAVATAPSAAPSAALDERPHRTLLGVL